eukprot:scaffold190764_cov36-Tisochrysis_lutea.AAC.1
MASVMERAAPKAAPSEAPKGAKAACLARADLRPIADEVAIPETLKKLGAPPSHSRRVALAQAARASLPVCHRRRRPSDRAFESPLDGGVGPLLQEEVLHFTLYSTLDYSR